MARLTKSSLGLLGLLPVVAYAEVMDKEFSLGVVLIWLILGSIACFAAARYHPRLLLLPVVMTAGFFAAQLSEVLDPHVGPAIWNEAGFIYVFASWAGPVGLVLAVSLGLLGRRRSSGGSPVNNSGGG